MRPTEKWPFRGLGERNAHCSSPLIRVIWNSIRERVTTRREGKRFKAEGVIELSGEDYCFDLEGEVD